MSSWTQAALDFHRDLSVQGAVQHVLLTHAHIDHIASLGPLIDNTRQPTDEPLIIHCSESVGESLRRHYFNDVLWPDLLNLPSSAQPYARLSIFRPGHWFSVAEFKVLPIEVNHTVPCVGFFIRDDKATVLLSGDTGVTDEIWRHARRCESLKAVILEVAFPNELQAHAQVAMHLTPNDFGRELTKLADQSVRLFAVHLKAQHQQSVEQELEELGLARLERLEPGREYTI